MKVDEFGSCGAPLEDPDFVAKDLHGYVRLPPFVELLVMKGDFRDILAQRSGIKFQAKGGRVSIPSVLLRSERWAVVTVGGMNQRWEVSR